MKASTLDRTVTIERQGPPFDDGYGVVPGAWETLATVPAQVIQQGGGEYLKADTIIAEQRVVFRLRWLDGLSVLDRVIYDDRAHEIKEVKELGRREGTELLTVAEAD